LPVGKHQSVMLVLAGLIVAAGMVAGCGAIGGCDSPIVPAACTHGPTGMPGGLSRDAAIADARAAAPAGGSATLVWAAIEPDPFVQPGASGSKLVWDVRLTGATTSACPAGLLERSPSVTDQACLDADGGVIAVLDYFTGAFIGWTH